jgi:hypothetical protein
LFLVLSPRTLLVTAFIFHVLKLISVNIFFLYLMVEMLKDKQIQIVFFVFLVLG